MPELLDISYTAHPDSNPDRLRQFDLYLLPDKPSTPAPLVCFVHGGAWRSYVLAVPLTDLSTLLNAALILSEDKSSHADLARRLLAATSFPVAVPNYRLTTPTTPHRHPTHAHDLLQFLEFVLQWSGADSESDTPPYDPTRIFVIGHSCSAHMLASIFLAPPSPHPPDILAPSPALLRATRGLVVSEGIYDLDLLLQSFPTYRSWFVAHAFGNLPSYAAFNVAAYVLRPGAEDVRWCVLHDRNDPLVDVVQSETMAARLRELYGVVGKDRAVRVDLDALTVRGHNDIFREEAYVRLVKESVQSVDA